MKQALEVTMNIIEGKKYRKSGQTNVGQLGKELKSRRSENVQKY